MTAPDPKAVIDALTNQEIADVRRSADEGPLNCEGCGAVCLCSQIMMACDELIAAKSALSAEIAANAMLREALEVAKAWMVTQQKIMLADEGFSPSVTALESDIHAVNKALATSPSSIAARVMALEALSDKIEALRIATSNRAVEELGKVCQALAAFTPSK